MSILTSRGLRNRGSLTVWISLTAGKLVNWDAPRPRRRKPGRQRKYSNHAIETAVTLGMVFHLSSRQSEGLLRSLFALMKLDNDVPDHTTISRRKAKLGKVPFYQDKQKTPLHILIDSSGLAVHAYYVLVVIELSSRKVHIAGITQGPDGPFMMQVGRNLTDPFDGFLRGKRFLILDRDKKFTTEFRDLLEHAGTDVIRLPHLSPNLNAYVERFVLSIKSECLERMIFFSEQSLRRAVAEFIHHYHGERNHQGLGNALLEAEECVGSPHGKVRCRKRLGGLLSYYHRDAA